MATSDQIAVDEIARLELIMQRHERIARVLPIAVLIALWIVVTEMRWVPPLFLPTPENLWSAAQNLITNLPSDLFASLVRRILPGFAIGVSLGTLLGVLMAMNRLARAAFEPIVEILRPLPPLALIPLLILWLGIGYATHILLIAYGSFIIMVVNSYEAVRNVPPIYIHAATTLGATPRQIFRRVIIPSIVPDIIAGVRVSAAASFGYCVAAELMGAMTGLGYRLVLARRYLLTENIIVILVVIAVLSFSIDYGIRQVDEVLTSWKPRIAQK